MLINGSPAAKALDERTKKLVESNALHGEETVLAVFRMGEAQDDIRYERSVTKKAEKLGIKVLSKSLPKEAGEQEVERAVSDLASDEKISGLLIMLPLPDHIDEKRVKAVIPPEKDVDGVTEASAVSLYLGGRDCFAPCTAEACIEMCRYYGISLDGKNAVVIGRSLVVGKPLAMMLLRENATVTVCHTHTENLKDICKRADIVFCASGKANIIGADHVSEDQIIIDVGINDDGSGGVTGDVDREKVEPIVKMLTPVPGGIGSLTTSVLLHNTAKAQNRRS